MMDTMTKDDWLILLYVSFIIGSALGFIIGIGWSS